MCGSRSETTIPHQIAIKDYAAGALLANAPMWIISSVLPSEWSRQSVVLVGLLNYLIAMAGGASAGYLIARKTGQSYLKAGLPTGFFSYSLYAVSMSLIGVKGGFIEDVPALFGFFIGGAVGARYWERLSQQIRRKQGEDPGESMQQP